MILRITVLLGLVMSIPLLLRSQEKWTLDDCIRHAYENNIELKQEELKVALQSHLLQRSKLDLLPSVNLRSAFTNRFGRSVDPLTYEFTTDDTRGASLSAYSGVNLFRGFQGINTLRKTKIDLDKNLYEYEQAKKDLALNITRDFLQILFYDELLKVAEQELKITEQQVNRTQILVSAGSLTKGDLLEIQAMYAMDELNVVNAKNNYDLSLLSLALLLEIEEPNAFAIHEPTVKPIPAFFTQDNPENIFTESQGLMPSIKGAELGIQSSQKDLSIAKGSLSPSLSLTTGWGTGYSDQILDLATGNIMPISQQLGFASTTYLGFSLNIPVFNGLSGLINVKDAKLSLMNSHLQLDAEKNKLRKEIHLAYADAHAAFLKHQATQSSLESLQLAFENIQRKYNAGSLTALDYNTAKNNLLTAQSELLQAKYHYLFNIKILNFYRGINE